MPSESQRANWEFADEQLRKKLPPGIKLIRTLRGHTGTIGRFAWSPCGNFIASPSFDCTIRIWDTSTGEISKEIKGNTERAVTTAWAPNGSCILSASGQQRIRVWDPKTGAMLRKVDRVHQRPIVTLSWSPDGRYFASGGADGAIGIWDGSSFELIKKLHPGGTVMGLAWSHAANRLASSGSGKGRATIWQNGEWQNITPTWMAAGGPTGEVYGIAWSMDDKHVLCACSDNTVTVFNIEGGEIARLEGHTGEVKAVSCSPDGTLIASRGGVNDNSIRIWRIDSMSPVCILRESSTNSWRPSIAFHPTAPILATLGERESSIRLWELDPKVLLRSQSAPTITYTSAKVVLVGESNVGKSYLAHRIATGLPPQPGTIKSTHGMKFWPLETDKPNPSAKAPANNQGQPSQYRDKLLGQAAATTLSERRDVILWDMGGQEEYRLIHQLFLHDTTVALVLVDPTRGMTAFKEVETWNKSLEKQLRGRSAVKLLVGAKIDQPSDVIDRQSLDRLRKECGFANYHETSAITGRGVTELCEALGKTIDWNGLGKTSRPELFQRIRDELEIRRKRGEVVLRVADLQSAIADQDTELKELIAKVGADLVSRNIVKAAGESFAICADVVLPGSTSAGSIRAIDLTYQAYEKLQVWWASGRSVFGFGELQQAVIAKDLLAVVEQLAAQGLVARSKVSTGEQVLVLQVQEIERYAGSLILAARNNPRGVPALELRAVAQEGFLLPGIADKERLPREQEKPVVECTVQLMLEHGICFEHEGLLIFPSLFSPGSGAADAKVPHSVALYYDFAGAIDNIYASLVAWLVLAKEFGKVCLWSNRAEFELKDGGLCGLLKKSQPGGFAHVDVYFEAETPERKRKEFISFVEDHLSRNGVEIKEQIVVPCPRDFIFDQETLRIRIAEGAKDVMCPRCEERHSLMEGAAEVRERDPKIVQHTLALRTRIEELRDEVTTTLVKALTKADKHKAIPGPIRLLHLSDLHFTKDTSVPARLQLGLLRKNVQ